MLLNRGSIVAVSKTDLLFIQVGKLSISFRVVEIFGRSVRRINADYRNNSIRIHINFMFYSILVKDSLTG